ncbi:MAG: hypothetical protein U9N34_08595, partial [Candidatus Cloacimonadota bacterium]|nr:hypothetical protein [Candidatus Cloacimonadota bacterium]
MNWSLCPGNETPNAYERFDLYGGSIFPSCVFGGSILVEGWQCYYENFQNGIDHSGGENAIADIFIDFSDSDNLIVEADIGFSVTVPVETRVIFALSCRNPDVASWDYVVIDSSEPIIIDDTSAGSSNYFEYQFSPEDLILYEMEFLPENYYAVVIVQEWISKKILQAQ